MASIESLRNNIISKLQTVTDIRRLEKVDRYLDEDDVNLEVHQLTDAQKKMLEMSEEDIRMGRVISQEDLDKKDLEWLNGL